MIRRLAGKIAAITGGAGGLGQAIAERFAAEGADIAIIDLAPATETAAKVEAHGRRCAPIICDISDAGAVAGLRQQVNAVLGHADILVNNAAIMKKIAFEDLDFATWRRFFSINLDGMFLMTKEFLPDLKQSSGGRIINMTSTSVWLSVPNFVHYITTKASIMGFTNSLASELGSSGITVNAIAPSLVRTPGSTGLNSEEDFPMIAAMQVIHREQTPGDVTGAAVFLASAEAGFVTGQTIAVDGGLTRR